MKWAAVLYLVVYRKGFVSPTALPYGLRCLCERVYVMSQRKYHTRGIRIPFSTVPLLSGGCADVRMLASCGWYTAILPHLLVGKVLYSLQNHWRLAPSNVGLFFNY